MAVDKKTKQNFLLIAFGVLLYALLNNATVLSQLVGSLWTLVYPVALGFILAFILNVPMAGLERRAEKLTSRWKKRPNESAVSLCCLLITILGVLLVVAATMALLIPSLTESLVSLYDLVMSKWPEWSEVLRARNVDTSTINNFLNSLDAKNLLQSLTSGAGSLITTTVGAMSSLVSSLANIVLALIIACYVLLSKKTLCRQAKKLTRAYLPKKVAEYLIRAAGLVNTTYSRFFSGQCVEACILALMMFLFLTVFGMPYAALVAVLAAVCAFIPYIGSFVSCAVGAFLVLLVSPEQVLWFILLYIAVQFVENQFIYPHVVGSSVGLSPLWTLIAVLIGGNLMGVLGMVFFIPLVSVFQTLLTERTRRILREKDILSGDPPEKT